MGLNRIALYLPSLRGGGAERVMVNLARGFADRGHRVDLVLARAEGPYLEDVPPAVRVVDLQSTRVLASLPGLVRYLRREQPDALLSTLGHANIVALWSKLLSGVSTRVVVRVANTLSVPTSNSVIFRGNFSTLLARWFYPWAHSIVAVSKGVADDLVETTGLQEQKINVIYNPAVTPELFKKAKGPIDHPWFNPGQPPVILGVGRLTRAKDFPTLIRAFALIRRKCSVRLMILGEGEDRFGLEALVKKLGVEKDASLLGFVDNPFGYMARAGVFVLSSRWEGLPNVLIQAMACGCPVVSTDCPSGPVEILENGKYGPLVPVGDVEALSWTIMRVMDTTPDQRALVSRAKAFSLETSCRRYLDVLGF